MIAIGAFHPKFEVNLGTLWRAAHLFGAAQIFTILHDRLVKAHKAVHA